MNLLALSWKNIINKPLSMTLSLILFGLGVGLISLLLLLNTQLEEKFEANLAEIDLVIGAKGSPLQLILSSMYHIDAPTGNVSIEEVKPFLNPKHPLIKTAVPLSLGDNHKGYRIVGTTPEFVDLYNAQTAEGRIFAQRMEVTVGATVANALELSIGSTFQSSHGFVQDDNLVHEHQTPLQVVGILEPTGSVIDQLILTNTQTVWAVHGHEEEDDAAGDDDDDEEEEHDHDDHAEGEDHDHEHEHDHAEVKPLTEYPEEEITSLLIRFKGRNYQALNMQRSINENTDMQAATPAIEINRLYSLIGVGAEALRWLAIIIVAVSGLSIFISLFSSLRDRRYELALMRTMGGSRGFLFGMIILEGLILAVLGYTIGIALSHIGMEVLAENLSESYRYTFTGWRFLTQEWYLLAGALGIGFIAAVIPAVQASRTDIHQTLSEG